MTLKVARLYHEIIAAEADEVHLLSLEEMVMHERNSRLIKLEEQLLIPSDKFLFVIPEYNGSFPGILKLLIDNSDIRRCWWHKKAAITGVADGRGGNLRGIDHLTNILHYLKMNVLYNKLPISKINEEISADGQILKPVTTHIIRQQVNEFLQF